MIVQLSLIAALAVLAEAALSYLGLTPVSTPSWGRMLETLQPTVTVHPGALVFPGLAVVAATLGFNLLGDGLRDAVDPAARRGGASPTFASVVDQVDDPPSHPWGSVSRMRPRHAACWPLPAGAGRSHELTATMTPCWRSPT